MGVQGVEEADREGRGGSKPRSLAGNVSDRMNLDGLVHAGELEHLPEDFVLEVVRALHVLRFRVGPGSSGRTFRSREHE